MLLKAKLEQYYIVIRTGFLSNVLFVQSVQQHCWYL